MDRSVEAEVIARRSMSRCRIHVRVAEMALERAKRLVEAQRDVVILLDSITRLTRAYNLTVPASRPHAVRWYRSGRALPAQALLRCCPQDRRRRQPDYHRHLPGRYRQPHGRRDLRRVQGHRQHGAAPRTGSLSERRIFPAFDIVRSGTRREELLLTPETLQRVWTLRRMIDMLRQSGEDPLEPVLERMRRTRNNKVFLDTLSQSI